MTKEQFIQSILLAAKAAGPFGDFEERLRYNLLKYEESKKKREAQANTLLVDIVGIIFGIKPALPAAPEKESNLPSVVETPITIPPMTCEYPRCTSTHGRDYQRKESAPGYEHEPIFLCGRHSSGFIPV